MKIIDILKNKKMLYSYEFFPYKNKKEQDIFESTIEELNKYPTDFVSVTYGAGGSSQNFTINLTNYLRSKGYNTMMHLTCVNKSFEEIEEIVGCKQLDGIENYMLLRGDIPEGKGLIDFRYASDLTNFIGKRFPELCLGGACYPEIHPEAINLEEDVENLKKKIDEGISFLITQLFFDNDTFLRFRDKAYNMGITVPIIPGILPVTGYEQATRIATMCKASITEGLRTTLEGLDKDSSFKAGINFSANQCNELIREGIPGLHFYTLNRSKAIIELMKNMGRERLNEI